MKKIILIVLFFGISIMFWTPAMAEKEPGALPPAPVIKKVKLHPDRICFKWNFVGVEYLFLNNSFGAFGELVPILDLTPDTEFDLKFNVGIRYLF